MGAATVLETGSRGEAQNLSNGKHVEERDEDVPPPATPPMLDDTVSTSVRGSVRTRPAANGAHKKSVTKEEASEVWV